MASTGLDLIMDPELLRSAKAEFVKRTGGKNVFHRTAEQLSVMIAFGPGSL